MVEAAKDSIPLTVTNGLGFEPIRPHVDQSALPKTKGQFDRRTDLYLHLAEMDLRVSDNPFERSQIEQFFKDTQEWRRGLQRVGMGDFDVKRPEELVTRVSESIRNGPLDRTTVRYVPVPEIPAPGYVRLRREVAFLAAGILLTLLTTTHTEVLAQSYNRTVAGLQNKCTTLIPQIKSEHPGEYTQYVTSSDSPDPDNNLIQECTKIAERYYHTEDDLLKAVTDGERMLRAGFSLTMLGGIGSIVVGGYLLAEGLVGRFRRRDKKTS